MRVYPRPPKGAAYRLILTDVGNPILPCAAPVVCRGAELERSLAGVQEDRRLREIRRHTRTQSQFLRLRRTKIGLRDFRTVKVIGKGAFGEVSLVLCGGLFLLLLGLPPDLRLRP